MRCSTFPASAPRPGSADAEASSWKRKNCLSLRRGEAPFALPPARKHRAMQTIKIAHQSAPPARVMRRAVEAATSGTRGESVAVCPRPSSSAPRSASSALCARLDPGAGSNTRGLAGGVRGGADGGGGEADGGGGDAVGGGGAGDADGGGGGDVGEEGGGSEGEADGGGGDGLNEHVSNVHEV